MEDLKELLAFHIPNILCADVCVNRGEHVEHIILKIGYTEEELQQFLCDIDFTDSNLYYDDVDGTVWLKDGNWITKSFVPYDNDIWEWNYKPEIPDACNVEEPTLVVNLGRIEDWVNMDVQ